VTPTGAGRPPRPAGALQAAEVQALGEHGAFVREGFLGRTLACAARDELASLEPALRPAGMGRGGKHRDARERGDATLWLDREAEGPALAALRAAFDALGQGLRRQAYLGLGAPDIQVARYPGGGARYARHRDAFRETVGPERRVTAIVYLNPDWTESDGGLLRLHLLSGPRDVAPLLDRLVVFLSGSVEHEVLATHAPRWAVTAWYRGP
jgi:SM-20-related protein